MMIGSEVAGPSLAGVPAASPSGSPAAAAPAAPAPSLPPVPNALTAASVTFELDRDTGKPVVRIVDPDSGTVIRQMPTEEMLAIARDLGRTEGLMIHVKA